MKNEVIDAAYELQKTYPGISVQTAVDVIQGQRTNGWLVHIEEQLARIADSLEEIKSSIGGPACGPSIPPEIEGLAKSAKAKR